jgi:hypothetical protein
MKRAALLLVASCATVPDRPAAPPDLAFDRDRLDGTLARLVDLALAGQTSRELFDRYHANYAVELRDGLLFVTVYAEPAREITPSAVAAAIEHAGGTVLEGSEGVVRARLTLDQSGTLSRDPTIRILRLTRHHESLK